MIPISNIDFFDFDGVYIAVTLYLDNVRHERPTTACRCGLPRWRGYASLHCLFPNFLFRLQGDWRWWKRHSTRG
jgi:hypothetical protein